VKFAADPALACPQIAFHSSRSKTLVNALEIP
jgi:hypothetical protein